MSLTPEQVDKIAVLARLELTPEERADFTRQLSDILGYVGRLQEVNTAGIEPLEHVGDLLNATRTDLVKEADRPTHERLLGSFPEREGDLLKVKAVF